MGMENEKKKEKERKEKRELSLFPSVLSMDKTKKKFALTYLCPLPHLLSMLRACIVERKEFVYEQPV